MEDKHKETTSAGGVVMNSKGEVLVVSQGGTSWSLPKGHVEVGEDSLKAAKREIAGLLTHPKDKEFFLSIRDKI